MIPPTVAGPGAVVLLHGVGLDPQLFAPLVDRLPPAIGATAPLRDPYARGRGSAVSIPDQTAAVLATLDRTGPAIVVGVSGGATLALALAIAGSPSLLGVIAHEPLVGPLAADLDALVAAAAAQLDATPGPAAAVEFVRGLVGAATWARLPDRAHRFAFEHAATIRREVPQFATFAPTAGDLERIGTPLVVTTGATSALCRHAAAAVLADLAGADVVVLPDAGHLACWEQPALLAEVICDRRSTWRAAA